MSEPIGRIVLRGVADCYRRHPELWCGGAGPLFQEIADEDGNLFLPDPKPDPGKPGCIHTMILYQSVLRAGQRAAQHAADQAIKILCEHHQLAVDRYSIFAFNDDNRCGSAAKAIEFVEAPLLNASPIGLASARPRMSPRVLNTVSVLMAFITFAVVTIFPRA